MQTNRTILVTGINGFVGHHLARELKKQGHTVYGTGMAAKVDENLHGSVDKYIGACDLTKPEDVKKLPFDKIEVVINLAGLSQMGASFGQEDLYMRTNVLVHTTIADELLRAGKNGRMISVSSGAVYDPSQPMPLKETSKLAPQSSPYARSKIAMEEAMGDYRQKGLDVIIARPFNHIGPGQTSGFLVPDLAAGLLKDSPLVVGNLKTERDYTDVRDVVKAYILLATIPQPKHHVYNVCRGRSVSGQVVLGLLKEYMGKQTMEIRVDKARFRPNDAMRHLGSNTRLVNDTGWAPEIPLEQTIKDFVEWFKTTV
jgi:GDP-4-dehydro-6-deoxy-D-mannose reductase